MKCDLNKDMLEFWLTPITVCFVIVLFVCRTIRGRNVGARMGFVYCYYL